MVYNRDNNIDDVVYIQHALTQIITTLLDLSIIYLFCHSNSAFMIDQLSWIQSYKYHISTMHIVCNLQLP